MSSTGFSNADAGSKNADPYKQHNVDTEGVSLKTKVEDLVEFVENLKFGMMTTRQHDTGLLVSRCMALAAKVRGFVRGRDQEMDGGGTNAKVLHAAGKWRGFAVPYEY